MRRVWGDDEHPPVVCVCKRDLPPDLATMMLITLLSSGSSYGSLSVTDLAPTPLLRRHRLPAHPDVVDHLLDGRGGFVHLLCLPILAALYTQQSPPWQPPQPPTSMSSLLHGYDPPRGEVVYVVHGRAGRRVRRALQFWPQLWPHAARDEGVKDCVDPRGAGRTFCTAAGWPAPPSGPWCGKASG